MRYSVRQLTHCLMAVLTLLAAFAFQVRADGRLPTWWAAVPGGVAVSLRPPAAPQHGAHALPGLPAPAPGAPAPDQAHSHGAHCLFCVTNAFGLDDPPFDVGRGPTFGAWTPLFPTPQTIPALKRHADARAPPAV